MPCPNCDSNNSRKNRQIGDRQTKVPKFTPEEYFIWEEKQLLRHEYINGEVYAMTRGTQNHGRIASNIIFIVKGHLRGSGCQVGNSDCRVNILETKDLDNSYSELLAAALRYRTPNLFLNFYHNQFSNLSPSIFNKSESLEMRIRSRTIAVAAIKMSASWIGVPLAFNLA